MHPTLEVPLLGTLRTSALFIQLGVLFCIVVGPIWAGALEGLPRARVRRALVVLLLLGLAGGRLHFILNYPYAYADHPFLALRLWTGGFHVGGGILLLVLAAPWVTRWFGVPLGRFADGVTPSVGVGLAIVRLGCLMQGCCFGNPCTHAWCLAYPRGSDAFLIHSQLGWLAPGAEYSLPVHPLHLYFAAAGLLVACVALAVHALKRYDGQAGLYGLLAFTTTSAALEFLRTDEGIRIYWGPLPQLAWTAIAMTLSVIVALAVAEWRSAGRTSPVRSAEAAG